MATIAENLARVRERIAQAATRTGRDVNKIKLVAVSKGQSLKKIEEAVAAGVDILGENFIQEARGKIAGLTTKVSWHFVGHLQTNKARFAARLFDLIHSLDSIRLAEELNSQGEKLGKRIPVLVQVNVSGEETKFGVERDQAVALVKGVASFPQLEVLGLMTITPLFKDPEKCRPYYRALRHIRHQVVSVMPELELKELSMGMSADFEVAVEEGATLVRVGTAVFGPRERK